MEYACFWMMVLKTRLLTHIDFARIRWYVRHKAEQEF
jgi:hypothetical protein